jgi:hypothetical protein
MPPRTIMIMSEARVSDDWVFADPGNLAVITLRAILRGADPILHVVHDADDGGWQFLGWGDAREDDAVVVSLRTATRLDESVEELADLPPGWHAWRASPDHPWRRAPVPGGGA